MAQVEGIRSGGGRWSVARNSNGTDRSPDFARTFAGLKDAELLEEIAGGRGGEDFQAAAIEEAGRRGLDTGVE